MELGLVNHNGAPLEASKQQQVVRGVVAGAQEALWLVNLTYRIRADDPRTELTGDVGVTGADLGCDILVSKSDISRVQYQGGFLGIRCPDY